MKMLECDGCARHSFFSALASFCGKLRKRYFWTVSVYSVNLLGVKSVCLGGDLETMVRVEAIPRV